MTVLVRAAALTSYEETARSLGLDPYDMLRRAGIPASVLSQSDARVPVTAVQKLLEQSASLSGAEDFGLRMAQTRKLSVLGALGLAVRDAPDLKTVLQMVFEHLRMHNESMAMGMEEADGYSTLRMHLMLPRRVGTHQATELSMGTLVRVMKVYLGESWVPTRVCFTHPSPMNSALHRRMFGSSLEFGGEMDGVICRTSDLEQPIPSADPVMAAYARKQLEAGLARDGGSATEREVRQLILILLPSARCSIDQVARHLCKDRRTIHRQLLRQSLSFSQLVQEIRSDLSDTYLLQSGRQLADMAMMLGFSGASAYSRWHRQRFGETVAQRRRRLLNRAD